MATKKVKFMCTAFRDGFQSVYGARVLTEDFMPAVEAARNAGINWFEAGGGARFQSLYFYCNEDAFHMMDRFREVAGPDADLQTLARGVNVVGLDSQSSDVINLHAKLFKKHGISTIRNFDALNDVNNLIYSGQCIHDAGLKHQVCITLMELPPGCSGAHDANFYMQVLKGILDADLPFDSICFKDASGTAVPSKIHETIKAARKLLGDDVHIHFHSHETAGICIAGYMAALEAGADAVDLSMSPVSGGTCQSDIITMWHALRGTDFDLDVDIDKVREAESVFKACMSDYFLPPEATTVEPMIPWSPMPGGALTANTQMLRDNGLMDRYPEIIAAMGEVVRRGGFGTSVTPVSQFYFQQAFNNVMMGPWKKIAEGYGKMVLGYFGKTPAKPDPEIVKLASEQLNLEPTEKTVREINDADETKGLAVAKKMLADKGLDATEENVFIAATCKEKGIAYLKGEAKLGVRKNEAPAATPEAGGAATSGYTVTVNGNRYAIELGDDTATVNGNTYSVSLKEGAEGTGGGDTPATASGDDQTTVSAPLPGVIIKINVHEGDSVSEGDVLLVMEAMKMEQEIKASKAGTVASIDAGVGDQIQAGGALIHLSSGDFE